jgi:hypothetical protein
VALATPVRTTVMMTVPTTVQFRSTMLMAMSVQLVESPRW